MFGPSAGYEAFLISRVHERWRLTGDPPQSRLDALDSSGRVITRPPRS
jgi:RND superfamily putative drug exporter